jgi:hypothetical protein
LQSFRGKISWVGFTETKSFLAFAKIMFSHR